MTSEKQKAKSRKLTPSEKLATPNGARREGAAHLTPARSPARSGSELELLTQAEIGARLKVTVRTVVRLQHDGVLPFIELGKRVRFYWPAVIAHLISNFTMCRLSRPPGKFVDAQKLKVETLPGEVTGRLHGPGKTEMGGGR